VQCCAATSPHFWKVCASLSWLLHVWCRQEQHTTFASQKVSLHPPPLAFGRCVAPSMLHVSVDGRCHASLCHDTVHQTGGVALPCCVVGQPCLCVSVKCRVVIKVRRWSWHCCATSSPCFSLTEGGGSEFFPCLLLVESGNVPGNCVIK